MHSSKTKLVWSVSSSYLEDCFEKGKIEHLAQELRSFGVDAIRSPFTKSSEKNLVQLKDYLGGASGIPFILSPLGRKATLRVKNCSLEVEANSEISGLILVDFQHCALTQPKSTPDLSLFPANIAQNSDCQIVFSSLDMLSAAAIISFETIGNNAAFVKLKFKDSGLLLSGMDVHSSALSRDLFPLLPEDKESIESGFNHLADYVLINGCNNIEEIRVLKEMCLGNTQRLTKRHPSVSVGSDAKTRKAQLPPKFLFKVDSAQALSSLSEFLSEVDGIVFSRSELSLTVPLNTLPIVQKQVLAQCNQAAKLVIVASEIMYSMRLNPNPTRAEVSDLANTALDGADAVLISEEVTEGPYRLLVPEVCNDTLLNSEKQTVQNWNRVPFAIQNEDDAVAYGALHIAQQAQAQAIVCLTEGGYTAQRLASLRAPVAVIAMTYNECIARQLNVLRAVQSHVLENTVALDDILAVTKSTLVKEKVLTKGDKFVFLSLSASSVSQKNSNLFTLQEIE
jgi:pyruvate kinase